MSYDLSGYVDVASRIAEFKEKYPQGSLQSECLRLDDGWFVKAWAYRTPDDERPGMGHALEPVPGKTTYTRDSELMNAETSAWGRAIVALGFGTRQAEPRPAPKKEAASKKADPPPEPEQSSFQPPAGATTPEPEGDKRAKKKGYALLKNLEAKDPAYSEVKPHLIENFGSDNPYKMGDDMLELANEWMQQRLQDVLAVGAGFASAHDSDIPF